MSFDFAKPQFSTQELLACVPGLSHETFKQWLSRSVVLLSSGPNIGKGRRPQHRGADVVQVGSIFELARQGILVSKAKFIWSLVNSRIVAKQVSFTHGLPIIEPGPVSALFHLDPASGDLMVRQFSEASPDEDPAVLADPDAPNVVVLFRIDRFIDDMTRRMERVKAGLPAFEPREPTPPTDEDFFRQWATDAAGNRVLVGLTAAETKWYHAYQAKKQASRENGNAFPWGSAEEMHEEQTRWLSLHDKHEEARLRRIGEEIAARNSKESDTS